MHEQLFHLGSFSGISLSHLGAVGHDDQSETIVIALLHDLEDIVFPIHCGFYIEGKIYFVYKKPVFSKDTALFAYKIRCCSADPLSLRKLLKKDESSAAI